MKSQTQTLPTDIEFDILLRLPIKILCRFKSVSKSWLALIAQQEFVKSHLHKSKNNSPQVIVATHETLYSLDFQSPNCLSKKCINLTNKQPVQILGSCYGLLLMLMYDPKQFYDEKYSVLLWNPSTGIYRNIPLPGYLNMWDIHGLSYDSTRDDFKVVMVIDRDTDTKIPVWVFSSSNGSWKRIQDFPRVKPCHNRKNNVVLDGIPYWIARSCYKYVIVYFDPNEDKMKELPALEHQWDFELTVLGGNLCAVGGRDGLRVWVMKNLSWSKLLALSHSDFPLYKDRQHYSSWYVMPLCLTGENGMVMVISNNIVIFNMKENTFKLIKSPPCFKHSYQYHDLVSYVESLVSPYVSFGTRS